MNLLSRKAYSCCESIASSQLVHCLHSSSIFPFQYIQSVVPDSPPLMVSYTHTHRERQRGRGTEREKRDFTPNSSQSIEVSKSLLFFGLKGKYGAKKSLDGHVNPGLCSLLNTAFTARWTSKPSGLQSSADNEPTICPFTIPSQTQDMAIV